MDKSDLYYKGKFLLPAVEYKKPDDGIIIRRDNRGSIMFWLKVDRDWNSSSEHLVLTTTQYHIIEDPSQYDKSLGPGETILCGIQRQVRINFVFNSALGIRAAHKFRASVQHKWFSYVYNMDTRTLGAPCNPGREIMPYEYLQTIASTKEAEIPENCNIYAETWYLFAFRWADGTGTTQGNFGNRAPIAGAIYGEMRDNVGNRKPVQSLHCENKKLYDETLSDPAFAALDLQLLKRMLPTSSDSALILEQDRIDVGDPTGPSDAGDPMYMMPQMTMDDLRVTLNTDWIGTNGQATLPSRYVHLGEAGDPYGRFFGQFQPAAVKGKKVLGIMPTIRSAIDEQLVQAKVEMNPEKPYQYNISFITTEEGEKKPLYTSPLVDDVLLFYCDSKVQFLEN